MFNLQPGVSRNQWPETRAREPANFNLFVKQDARRPFSQHVCGLKQNRCAVLKLSPDIVEERTLCEHVEQQA
jgi:hypothetical protein